MSHLVCLSYYRSLRDVVLCKPGADAGETASIIDTEYGLREVRDEAEETVDHCSYDKK